MTADDVAWWTFLAALGSAVGGIAAALAAVASWWVALSAKAVQLRANDFGNCLEMVKQFAEAQRRMRDADEKHRAYEFRELMNLLETFAGMANDGLLPPSTRRFTTHLLIETAAYARIDPAMASMMREAVTGDETFAELRKFENRHAREVTGARKRYRMSA